MGKSTVLEYFDEGYKTTQKVARSRWATFLADCQDSRESGFKIYGIQSAYTKNFVRVGTVIDRDMISGLPGTGMKKCDLTGTGTEIINLPGPGPIISILPGPGPGPTIQFYRDDRDLTGMTGTKTGILILKAATFIYIIIEQFE